MKAKLFKKIAAPVLAFLACLLLLSSAAAGPASPVGVWDCVLSGHRTGTAYFEFDDDGTFFVVEALVPNKPKPGEVAEARNDRNGGGDATRGGFTTPDPAFQPSPQIFGSEVTDGRWFLDNKGRLIGYFIEVSALENCKTNTFVIDTSTFSSTFPFSETNKSTFCITSPIATNTVFDTNIFSGTIPISGTNTPAGNILCVTSTTATNTVFGTNTFTSVMPINVTNTIAPNISCVINSIGTNVFAIGTNIYTSEGRIVSTNTFLDTTNVVCITLPIATNAFSFYTNTYVTNVLTIQEIVTNTANGNVVIITSPIGTNFDSVPISYTNQETYYTFNYTEQTICYKSEYLEQTICATNTYTGQTICATNTYTGQTICNTTTYTEQTLCYTNIIICSAITNAISFVGKVVPDKRITLVCTTPFGKTLYRGVPFQELQDISGDWYGVKTQNGVAYQEFFSLSNGFANIYDVGGAGPGYSYHGIAILSSRNKISFVFGMDPPLPTQPVTVVRAVTGPFNRKNVEANTRGYDQPGGGTFTNRISFKATRFAQ